MPNRVQLRLRACGIHFNVAAINDFHDSDIAVVASMSSFTTPLLQFWASEHTNAVKFDLSVSKTTQVRGLNHTPWTCFPVLESLRYPENRIFRGTDSAHGSLLRLLRFSNMMFHLSPFFIDLPKDYFITLVPKLDRYLEDTSSSNTRARSDAGLAF